MKKKTLIELFVYIIIVVVSIVLILSGTTKSKPVQIHSDFSNVDQRGNKP